MEKLQDQVPAKSGNDAFELAYEAMGGKDEFNRVFAEFDPEPLAAARYDDLACTTHMFVIPPRLIQLFLTIYMLLHLFFDLVWDKFTKQSYVTMCE
jgi:hypothetical protein